MLKSYWILTDLLRETISHLSISEKVQPTCVRIVLWISMEAIPLCLLLNTPHLLSLTQHKFI